MQETHYLLQLHSEFKSSSVFTRLSQNQAKKIKNKTHNIFGHTQVILGPLHIHVYTSLHTHTHLYTVHACAHTYTHSVLHKTEWSVCLCAYVCVCIHLHMHVYILDYTPFLQSSLLLEMVANNLLSLISMVCRCEASDCHTREARRDACQHRVGLSQGHPGNVAQELSGSNHT